MRIVTIALAGALVASACSGNSSSGTERSATPPPASSPQGGPPASTPAPAAGPAQNAPASTPQSAPAQEPPGGAQSAAPAATAPARASGAPHTPKSGTTPASQSQPVSAVAAAVEPPSPPEPPPAPEPPAPVYKEVTIPQGTTLTLRLETPVASDANQVEDPVRAALRRSITVDGQVVVPADTTFHGTVTAADRAGKVKGLARVAVRFTRFSYEDEVIRIHTSSYARQAESTKKKDAAKIGIGAGAGALIGGIIGGGKGAAVGAGVGGGAGTGAVMATRGEEVRLAAGSEISVTLTEPITLRVRVQ